MRRYYQGVIENESCLSEEQKKTLGSMNQQQNLPFVTIMCK